MSRITAFLRLAYAGMALTLAPHCSFAQALNWSGIYFGGQVGYQVGTATSDYVDNLDGRTYTYRATAGLQGPSYGGFAGVRWQATQTFVIGAEASASKFRGKDTATSGLEMAPLWTGSGQVGMIIGARALAFVKAGYAQAAITSGSDLIDFTTRTHTGWTAGAGLDYAITDNLLLRIEGTHTELGSVTYPRLERDFGCNHRVCSSIAIAERGISLSTQTIAAGLALKF